jgi:threonine/homoserine/homoserine lactone efflux protein
MAPLITDGPIILVALLLLPRFQEFMPIVAGVSLLGGLYLLWIGSKLVRIRVIPMESQSIAGASLRSAVKVNLLNPSPYLFWFSVGGAYILLGTTAQALVFVAVAIGTLIASKILVAGITAAAKPLLQGVAYVRVMKVLAGGLIVFGGLLLVRSFEIAAGGKF